MAIMLKADVINRAYSKQRISGITSIPSSEDNELALETLEDLAHELEEARNICLGYNFEDEPDLNAPTNIAKKNKLVHSIHVDDKYVGFHEQDRFPYHYSRETNNKF